MRLIIVGAGAIGCTLAALLAMSGQAVTLLARGDTLDAVRRDGVRLTRIDGTHQVPVQVTGVPDGLGPQDAIFICTKAHSLGDVLPGLAPLIGPETCVVPMVNGVPWWYFQGVSGRLQGRAIEAVDPGGGLLAMLPWQQVLGAVVLITAERTAPGTVHSTNPLLLVLGEPDHTEHPRTHRLAAVLRAAGIDARVSTAIRDNVWTKVIANLTSNPLSVVTGATLDRLYSDPDIVPLVRKILHEALQVAAAYGARFPVDLQSFLAQGAGMGAVRTSMLQDFDQGRPLELAAIGDAIIELAALQGIDMPVTKDVIALARFRSKAARACASSPHASTTPIRVSQREAHA
ncbi:2-dehydropantoate 2-reductase [Pigmentiphaga aceris]|uniref:2-dehydropantoate 2-reductase n=2 Tax=Pigmentiphaga aceris TaxID=1940612 RepID=A0A5C0B2R4_9BURK|nr:2-dehydropantoate 2-reductase [Pigmentiphaga aceris]